MIFRLLTGAFFPLLLIKLHPEPGWLAGVLKPVSRLLEFYMLYGTKNKWSWPGKYLLIWIHGHWYRQYCFTDSKLNYHQSWQDHSRQSPNMFSTEHWYWWWVTAVKLLIMNCSAVLFSVEYYQAGNLNMNIVKQQNIISFSRERENQP